MKSGSEIKRIVPFIVKLRLPKTKVDHFINDSYKLPDKSLIILKKRKNGSIVLCYNPNNISEVNSLLNTYSKDTIIDLLTFGLRIPKENFGVLMYKLKEEDFFVLNKTFGEPKHAIIDVAFEVKGKNLDGIGLFIKKNMRELRIELPNFVK